MEEIEYKLKTNNSVLVVNAVEKLISNIQSKFKPLEKQKFVLENEDLRFLKEKCSSKETVVSLTACQGLLTLVEIGVLEIARTMSTMITLLPTAQNYSAIISTMGGLLVLDLKSRLIPGQQYSCQFSLKNPQHPFITVLEKNTNAVEDVFAQIHALCTSPDYTISSNSLELFRAVFLWMTCSPQHSDINSSRLWQLLLSLNQNKNQEQLLLECLSWQMTWNQKLLIRAFSAYSAVTDAMIYQQKKEYVIALVPILARISNELIKNGLDPRACYNLIERCFALEAPELKMVAGLAVLLLSENLSISPAVYLHELFNLLALSSFVALSLQWLQFPSCLTANALKVASKIIEVYQMNDACDTKLLIANLQANKIFQALIETDSHLSIVFRVCRNWERIREDPEKIQMWLESIDKVDMNLKLELFPFLFGLVLEKNYDEMFEEVWIKALKMALQLVDDKKELTVQLLPVLLYKIANDFSPKLKLECLRAVPLMAKSKENVPSALAILNKLKIGKAVPASFLIMLFSTLADVQVRCYPYLQELLVDCTMGRPELDFKWEVELAKAIAIKNICETQSASHGRELVPAVSSILNQCNDAAGALACGTALGALAALWRLHVVSPPSTWRALEPKLGRDRRVPVQIGLCNLLNEVPGLRVQSPEYDKFLTETAGRLWSYISDSSHPEVIEAACEALSKYKLDDYRLKDIPEVYRKTVKLPSSYCKTPADAARRPEDVLDYIPCEIWPEVFKYTNQAALEGVRKFASTLMSREIRGYRSGIYQPESRGEPTNLSYLSTSSVVRGIFDYVKRQATNPSFDCSDSTLLEMMRCLTADYPRPLPPGDLCFLHDLYHRGAHMHSQCILLAARQALTAGSAKRFLENYLGAINPEVIEESLIMTLFQLLPDLSRTVAPNTLRQPIEKCLEHAYSKIMTSKAKDVPESQVKELLFIKQLEYIKQTLELEKTHDANRTLLSQIIEKYMPLINCDNVAWSTYVTTCCCLAAPYLERMTSPSSWWEVSAELLRKACCIRAELARQGVSDTPLVWLNEIIDAAVGCVEEHSFVLREIAKAVCTARRDDVTRDWLLQLMARAQVVFTECEDTAGKDFICEVFVLSVIAASGHASLEPGGIEDLVSSSQLRYAALPAALAALVGHWGQCAPQIVEWLRHTRALRDINAKVRRACHRSLLALRHCSYLASANVWVRVLNDKQDFN
ncbi:Focadhesin [Eumeta japonica]|uniref:Focadhesin n=1 Tax=Eumeta variegata TaxID=151549 RepID=A0A4C1XJU0_EUMVA|nr:Focadhesin [Eumeta japonica]